MIKTTLKDVAYPIEHLVFKIDDPAMVNTFIQLDELIWTTALAKYPGFISKEVWINREVPGDVHTILIWETMEAWKSIPIEALKVIDRQFTETFSHPFAIVRRIHKETNHGLYKVRMTVQANE